MTIPATIHVPFEPGTVWLVGAGPGDPGLLTLHALDALAQADIIVYDALVSETVLALGRPEAVREFAGKRGGRPSPVQQDISIRLIELARQGKRVLRLKGGDPFVFGRGGEEAAVLAEAGIRFRVIPGITAGLGGLAYAGIPATTRGTNQVLVFAAGHPAAGEPDHVDWEALARLGQALVIYMGLSRLGEIARRLVAGGMPGDTPLGVLIQATLPGQRLIEATLAEAETVAAREQAAGPALIVIGSIVALRATLVPWLLAP